MRQSLKRIPYMLGDVRSSLSQNRKCCNHASLYESNYRKNSQNPNMEDTSSLKTVKTKLVILHIILHWQSKSRLNYLLLGFSLICICICRHSIFIEVESERAPSLSLCGIPNVSFTIQESSVIHLSMLLIQCL